MRNITAKIARFCIISSAFCAFFRAAAPVSTPPPWEPLLNGRDLAGWQAQDGKPVAWAPGPGAVIANGPSGGVSNIVTARKFGDVDLHIEFMIPKGSNSGVYLHGLYEVQVFDSYGKPNPDVHDCGAIYERWINGKGEGGTAPLVNASRRPGEWQTFDIRFRAPRFDAAGKKTANARFLEVRHNGIVVQKNVEAPGQTRASMSLAEAPENPLMLQGDHGPVTYRNIYVRPLGAEDIRWSASGPLIGALSRDGETYYSIKDPSIVRHEGKWHVFCTVRGKTRSHQIEYLSFRDWSDAAKPTRATLKLSDGYFCAPQVFYFRPHRKWYLLFQLADKTRQPVLQPAISTTTTIDKPDSWSKPTLLLDDPALGVKNWIDFWTVCDNSNCYLFFATLDGRMWRSGTRISDFPKGWSKPQVALEGDIYEASHTYRLKSGGYLTFIEAQGPGGRRYFKSYLADKLDGAWRPWAAWYDRAFASPANVSFRGEPWTDSFSHGELLRESNDETMTVDGSPLKLLIQGVADGDRQGKIYGEIPWRLGLLEAR